MAAVQMAVVMVQRVAAVAIFLGLMGTARAQEIYQWRDAAGHPHFSNVPTTESAPTGLRNEPAADAPNRGEVAEGESEAAAAPSPTDEDAAYSSDASTRRSTLEHQLRIAERRVKDIDTKLVTLARARTRNAQGSAATGGVGTGAAGAQSDEEQALAEQRAREAKAVDTLRSSYSGLHDEVTARLGTTPDWWINVR